MASAPTQDLLSKRKSCRPFRRTRPLRGGGLQRRSSEKWGETSPGRSANWHRWRDQPDQTPKRPVVKRLTAISAPTSKRQFSKPSFASDREKQKPIEKCAWR